jgi:hypothetical protein
MCHAWRIALGLAGGVGLVLGLGEMPTVRAQQTSSRLVVRPAIATTEEAPVQWTASGRRSRGRWRDPAERAAVQRAEHEGGQGTVVSSYEAPYEAQASGAGSRHSVQTHIELGPDEQLVEEGRRVNYDAPRMARRTIGTHIELAPGEQLVQESRSALRGAPQTARRTVGTHVELAPGEQLVADGQPTPAGPQGEQVFEEIEPGVVEGFGPDASFAGGQQGCGCGPGDLCGHDCGPCGTGHPGQHGFGFFCEPYGPGSRCCICIPMGLFENLGVMAGAQGFKGPVDDGINGNFGFHEGFEWGLPLCREWGVGAQLGLRTTQSNFEGLDDVGPGSDREQLFVTAGIFHRAVCGLQWGLVADILHETYFFNADLVQLRGELGLVGASHNEVGVWFAANTAEEVFDDQELRVTTNDLFALYFRHHFDEGAEARAWVGLTGNSDLIVGGDWVMPLSNKWVVRGDVSFLVPDEGTGHEGVVEETWNIGLSLIWFPFRPACREPDECWGMVSPFAPLLPVADNGYMMEETATP